MEFGISSSPSQLLCLADPLSGEHPCNALCDCCTATPGSTVPGTRETNPLFKMYMGKGNVEAEKETEGNGNDGLSTVPPPKLLRYVGL